MPRSIALWLYDARHADGAETADAIEYWFQFSGGIALWAKFERADDDASNTRHHPTGDAPPVTDGQPELLAAFELHGLIWAD